ncbi:MAG: DUF5709 domain-containing protein [Gordonia sp. (in: high G+C Gram-positive bacteria)]|uniref:DUF5709 domain-containing protein n=1 Tax=Gordonia sp. (in: high G+C Gram-positive bacteria) TaxID=84139 RepID=UPI0039E40DB9
MSDNDDNDVDYDVDQLQPDDTLDRPELDDVLDEGYDPPDRAPKGYGDEIDDQDPETLDERLAEEEPDVDYDSESDPDADFPSDDEVGDRRAGRLIAPDAGVNEDVDAQMLATDAGVDGAGASAEEAAVHVIDE